MKERQKGALVQSEMQAKGVKQSYQSTKRMPLQAGQARSKAASGRIRR